MNKIDKLIMLKKRREQKNKENASIRLDQEEPESKNEDNPTLTELRSLDQMLDNYIKSFGPSN